MRRKAVPKAKTTPKRKARTRRFADGAAITNTAPPGAPPITPGSPEDIAMQQRIWSGTQPDYNTQMNNEFRQQMGYAPGPGASQGMTGGTPVTPGMPDVDALTNQMNAVNPTGQATDQGNPATNGTGGGGGGGGGGGTPRKRTSGGGGGGGTRGSSIAGLASIAGGYYQPDAKTAALLKQVQDTAPNAAPAQRAATPPPPTPPQAPGAPVQGGMNEHISRGNALVAAARRQQQLLDSNDQTAEGSRARMAAAMGDTPAAKYTNATQQYNYGKQFFQSQTAGFNQLAANRRADAQRVQARVAAGNKPNATPTEKWYAANPNAMKKGGKVRKRKYDDGGGVDTDSGDNTPLDVSSAASAPLTGAAPSVPSTPDLDSMSFGQAFRAARSRDDDPGTFMWHGKKFSTDLASDKPKAKPKAASAASPTPTPKPKAPPQASPAALALSAALPRTAQMAPPPPTVGRATGQVTNDPYAASTAAYLKSIGAGPGYPARVGMAKGGGVKKMAKGGGSNPFGGNQAPPFGAKPSTPPAPPKAKGPPKPPPFQASKGPASFGGGKTPPASKTTPPAGSASPPPGGASDDMFKRGGKTKKFAKGGNPIKSNPFAKGPPAATPATPPNPFAKSSRFPLGKTREVPREFGKASPFQETSLSSSKGGKLKTKATNNLKTKAKGKKMAKGGVAKFAKGGGIDGCALRGHTRATRSK